MKVTPKDKESINVLELPWESLLWPSFINLEKIGNILWKLVLDPKDLERMRFL